MRRGKEVAEWKGNGALVLSELLTTQLPYLVKGKIEIKIIILHLFLDHMIIVVYDPRQGKAAILDR